MSPPCMLPGNREYAPDRRGFYSSNRSSLPAKSPHLIPPARKLHREAPLMMIPPVVLLRQLALTVHSPAAFLAPNHPHVLQQPPLMQIPSHRRRRLDELRALLPLVLLKKPPQPDENAEDLPLGSDLLAEFSTSLCPTSCSDESLRCPQAALGSLPIKISKSSFL